MIDGWGISHEIALIWMSLDFTDDQSTLDQVMAWCRQAASHYLSQCWPRSLSPYGVTRPQWVKCCCFWMEGFNNFTSSFIIDIMPHYLNVPFVRRQQSTYLPYQYCILTTWLKTVVTYVLMQWSHCNLVLSHQYEKGLVTALARVLSGVITRVIMT